MEQISNAINSLDCKTQNNAKDATNIAELVRDLNSLINNLNVSIQNAKFNNFETQ